MTERSTLVQVVACPKYCHEFAANLPISSPNWARFALDTWAGRPAANHAQSPLMGHRSQEGDDARQTSAPSSMIATDHTRLSARPRAVALRDRAFELCGAGGRGMLEPEDDPRQYPSHIGIEDDNSFVEREGRHGRRLCNHRHREA